MPDQFKSRISKQMPDVSFSSGEKIVEAQDFMTVVDQSVAQVGAKETGSSSDKNFHECDYLGFPGRQSARCGKPFVAGMHPKWQARKNWIAKSSLCSSRISLSRTCPQSNPPMPTPEKNPDKNARNTIEAAVTVMYYDTDAGGVVHNIVYLRFIEYARTLLAIQLGMSFEEVKRTNIHPVVVRTEIDYKRPAVLGDELSVHGRITEVRGARFYVEFEILRPADNALIVTCRQALALVQMPEGRVLRLPKGFPDTSFIGA
jgi:4-hydroxybenzoyl-CoA thioesterase/acyl-CoA thioester hydrolase